MATINSSIAVDTFPITPNDSNPLKSYGIKCRGTAGNVVVVTANGNTRTIPMTVGELDPIKVKQVLATGTTATGLWGYELTPV
jgi:hypothetical protein